MMKQPTHLFFYKFLGGTPHLFYVNRAELGGSCIGTKARLRVYPSTAKDKTWNIGDEYLSRLGGTLPNS